MCSAEIWAAGLKGFYSRGCCREGNELISPLRGGRLCCSFCYHPEDSQPPQQHFGRVSLNHPCLLENLCPVLMPCVDVVMNPELVLGILANLKQRTLTEVKVWELWVWVKVKSRDVEVLIRWSCLGLGGGKEGWGERAGERERRWGERERGRAGERERWNKFIA